ncbi:hypothetical protein [Ralstonia sp. ASV6]|uniref:type IVB secretion system protein IcmW n=1 Tax=Ralstonia sp. ASV6 TaxID=2795124 RepID=UPI001E2B498A|nr:hypothetical protein [Ralstonia sp. ASV6]
MAGNQKRGDGGPGSPTSFSISDPGHLASHFNAKDSTGQTLHAMLFLSSVEHWVLNRLKAEGEGMAEEVKVRLQRLDDLIINFRNQLPADNPDFLQVMSWLSIDQSVYVIEFLQSCQQDFFAQLMDFCKLNRLNDANANVMLNRFQALAKSRLINRILSQENVDYVNKTLLGIQ